MVKCRICESKCCRYFALQIDTPKTKSEFENIRWYLAHKGVSVYIDKRKWFLEVDNKCRYLTKDHRCGIYDKRPLICREHDPATCDSSEGEFGHDHVFKNLKEFDKYLAERFGKKRRKSRKS